uniref:Gamma-tubulin complex component n=1 Tax=Timema bartmani TaxID=61472 RepID=A0A7R9EW60_9NEOP|nr:unnamed protein product [Timema bartmani]
MIHEVIVALSGCPGSFAPENCLVSISDTFFHPGEKTLLEKLYRIASGYKTLQDFITNNIYRREPKQVHDKDHEVQDEAGNSQPKCGMYLQAFCNGLSQTLDPYRDDLVELEKKALADPHFTLSGVFCHVDKYSELFPVLVSITEEITLQKIHGSCMLNYLNRKLNTHVDEAKLSIECILFSCHKVLFKQLTSWLLYGRIIDSYGEFFIHKVSGESTTVSLMGTSGNTVDLNETTVPENVPDTLYPNFCDYKIRFEMLPSYIVPSLAYKILFIGQTILMFRTDTKSRNSYRYGESFKLTEEGSFIWGGREEALFKKMYDLQNMQRFDLTRFEDVIGEIRTCVAEHLWQLAVEKAEMFTQIKLMKDFFLLGRGELFLEFIKLADITLKKTPSSTSRRDVNLAFHIAARKILMTDEANLEKFYFTLPTKGISSSADDYFENGWTGLTLKYRVSWPLHLLFSESVLTNYNEMFRFLIRVKKVQIELHDVWISHMQTKTKKVSLCEPIVWQLRKNLMFFVDNLQYYLQVDVLESQYMMMQSVINETKDFDLVQKAHSTFLANILSQSFLLMNNPGSEKRLSDESSNLDVNRMRENPVHRGLALFLSLCEKFCYRVSEWSGPSPLNQETREELNEMGQQHEYLIKLLMQMLSNLRSHPCGAYLSQLLLRLDFNRWFSQNNGMVVSVTQS